MTESPSPRAGLPAPPAVAIVAENASFRFGGESAIPLHLFRILRERGIDAWLVVHERVRAELEQTLPGERERMVFTPDTRLHKLLFGISRLFPRRLSEVTFGLLLHLLTQLSQRRAVRRLVVGRGVELVHQPVPVAPRFPSLLYDLGVPVILGPLNGGMEYPPAFRGMESGFGRLAVGAGRRLSDLAQRLLPGKRRAAVVLVANSRTRQALPATRARVLEFVENGVDLRVWSPPAPGTGKDPAGFVFLGRLVDWKALDILLEAMVLVPSARLEVIGDGAMRGRWEAQARTLGLAGRVEFLGWQSPAECARRLGASAALLLPSLFECGGAVVLEAMALGLPVAATRWGGPADYLSAETGVLVEPASRAAMVEGFAAAMQRWIDHPGEAEQMGRAGRAEVERVYDWQRKIDYFLDLYRSTLASGRP